MEKKYLFRYASVDGLILSSITVAALLISPLLSNVHYVVGLILNVAKIAGCLTLLYYFMKRYALANNCKRYGECLGYGLLVCLFSSFVCAAFSYISVEFIYSEIYGLQLLEMRDIFASRYGGSTDSWDYIFDNYSVIMFFSCFIYYFFIGLIFSAIFAGSVRVKDPFANNGESF